MRPGSDRRINAHARRPICSYAEMSDSVSELQLNKSTPPTDAEFESALSGASVISAFQSHCFHNEPLEHLLLPF